MPAQAKASKGKGRGKGRGRGRGRGKATGTTSTRTQKPPTPDAPVAEVSEELQDPSTPNVRTKSRKARSVDLPVEAAKGSDHEGRSKKRRKAEPVKPAESGDCGRKRKLFASEIDSMDTAEAGYFIMHDYFLIGNSI